MKRRLREWIVALTVVVLAVAYSGYRIGRVFADGVPSTSPLFYSGVIEENGALVEGARNIRLTVWDDASSSDSTRIKCTTLGSGVQVQRGQFRLPLDSACTNVVRSTSELWIEVEVQGTSLGRSKIGAVPYAVEAARAGEAAGKLAAQIAAAVTPPGIVMPFFGKVAPAGWLVADGSTINKTTNPEYAALVDHLRGVGAKYQGPTTSEAVLPDLQGVVLRGKSGLRSDEFRDPAGDQPVGTLELDSFSEHAHEATCPAGGNHAHSGTTGAGTAHTHGFSAQIDACSGCTAAGAGPAAGLNWARTSYNTDGGTAHSHDFTTSGGGHSHDITIAKAGGSETRSKSIIVLNLIKY